MNSAFTLLAQATSMATDVATRDTYELARLDTFVEARWFWAALVGFLAVLLLWVIAVYRRDVTELRPGVRWALFMLRITAIAAAVVFFLDIQKRTERKLVHNSRVLMLVDTSQSMGLSDNDASAVPATPSRIEQVVAELNEGSLVNDLRKVHDVLVVRFDRDSSRVLSLQKHDIGKNSEETVDVASAGYLDALAETRRLLTFSAALLAVGIVALVAFLALRNSPRSWPSWAYTLSIAAMIAAVVVAAVADLRNPDIGLLVAMGLRDAQEATEPPPEVTPNVEQPALLADGESAAEESQDDFDWKTALLPQGAETRLGSALKRILDEERSTPVAAIVVMTDGAHNAGIDPVSAARVAAEEEIPIFTVGIGADRRPVNVRVSDVIAPSRAYPGDGFTVTGYIQAQGLADRTVTVELLTRDASEPADAALLEDSARVTLGADGEVIPVKFELESEDSGRRTYLLRIAAPGEDRNTSDNLQEVDIEIVDRETRVLLLASAATREYRFLRNQFYRDKDVIVDVLLQSSRPGISQEADDILDDFPATKEELYEYDAIVAFDPDWSELDAHQIDLLEAWVAEEAGGLIVIAGPVQTDNWTRQPGLNKIKGLYPVEFYKRFTLLRDADYGAKEPWPIEFTREGSEAEFLWLDDSSSKSQAAWAGFPGVYGYYAVKRAKPGATVYGRFSNAEKSSGSELPVYLAGHFYGSGRVLYLGSGEFWRLRALDDAYFEKLYTKLIRHVSQGRLLRGSTQGVLLVERDRYLLGDTVVVRAQLSDAQHDPLDVPSVSLQLTRPDSTTETVTLKPNPSRAGMYAGQVTVLQEGVHRLDLPVPETVDEQLTRRIQVKVPDLERENPQRNDALLSELADSTGGQYFVGLNAALGHQGTKPLVGQLRDRRETITLSGSPDESYQRHLMMWLLGLMCGALFVEWLTRRLCKLA